MITQLNPQIPVMITSKNNRKGWAFALVHQGQDSHMIWGVILDDSGEVWWTPNPEIRVDVNWTYERRY